MTVGYRNSAGTDLDSVFAAYATGTKHPNCGFRTTGGQDLSDRFQPYVDGPKADVVGFRNGSGVDLKDLFAPFGWAPPTQLGFDGQTYLSARINPVARVTLNIKTDGTWSVVNNGGPGGSGTWDTFSGVPADFEVMFTPTITIDSPDIVNEAPTYMSIVTDREISVEMPDPAGFGGASVRCQIRRIATGVVVSDSTCTFEVEVTPG